MTRYLEVEAKQFLPILIKSEVLGIFADLEHRKAATSCFKSRKKQNTLSFI